MDVGTRAEAAVLAALVTRGYCVLTPYGNNHRYDMVLEDARMYVRIQCKSGRLRDGRILFNTLSTRTNTRGSVRTGYRGEADLFLVWCPEVNDVFCVPVDATTQSVATLRLTETRNGQQAGVRWASHHVIDVALERELAILRERLIGDRPGAPSALP